MLQSASSDARIETLRAIYGALSCKNARQRDQFALRVKYLGPCYSLTVAENTLRLWYALGALVAQAEALEARERRRIEAELAAAQAAAPTVVTVGIGISVSRRNVVDAATLAKLSAEPAYLAAFTFDARTAALRLCNFALDVYASDGDGSAGLTGGTFDRLTWLFSEVRETEGLPSSEGALATALVCLLSHPDLRWRALSSGDNETARSLASVLVYLAAVAAADTNIPKPGDTRSSPRSTGGSGGDDDDRRILVRPMDAHKSDDTHLPHNVYVAQHLLCSLLAHPDVQQAAFGDVGRETDDEVDDHRYVARVVLHLAEWGVTQDVRVSALAVVRDVRDKFSTCKAIGPTICTDASSTTYVRLLRRSLVVVPFAAPTVWAGVSQMLDKSLKDVALGVSCLLEHPEDADDAQVSRSLAQFVLSESESELPQVSMSSLTSAYFSKLASIQDAAAEARSLLNTHDFAELAVVDLSRIPVLALRRLIRQVSTGHSSAASVAASAAEMKRMRATLRNTCSAVRRCLIAIGRRPSASGVANVADAAARAVAAESCSTEVAVRWPLWKMDDAESEDSSQPLYATAASARAASIPQVGDAESTCAAWLSHLDAPARTSDATRAALKAQLQRLEDEYRRTLATYRQLRPRVSRQARATRVGVAPPARSWSWHCSYWGPPPADADLEAATPVTVPFVDKGLHNYALGGRVHPFRRKPTRPSVWVRAGGSSKAQRRRVQRVNLDGTLAPASSASADASETAVVEESEILWLGLPRHQIVVSDMDLDVLTVLSEVDDVRAGRDVASLWDPIRPRRSRVASVVLPATPTVEGRPPVVAVASPPRARRKSSVVGMMAARGIASKLQARRAARSAAPRPARRTPSLVERLVRLCTTKTPSAYFVEKTPTGASQAVPDAAEVSRMFVKDAMQPAVAVLAQLLGRSAYAGVRAMAVKLAFAVRNSGIAVALAKLAREVSVEALASPSKYRRLTGEDAGFFDLLLFATSASAALLRTSVHGLDVSASDRRALLDDMVEQLSLQSPSSWWLDELLLRLLVARRDPIAMRDSTELADARLRMLASLAALCRAVASQPRGDHEPPVLRARLLRCALAAALSVSCCEGSPLPGPLQKWVGEFRTDSVDLASPAQVKRTATELVSVACSATYWSGAAALKIDAEDPEELWTVMQALLDVATRRCGDDVAAAECMRAARLTVLAIICNCVEDPRDTDAMGRLSPAVKPHERFMRFGVRVAKPRARFAASLIDAAPKLLDGTPADTGDMEAMSWFLSLVHATRAHLSAGEDLLRVLQPLVDGVQSGNAVRRVGAQDTLLVLLPERDMGVIDCFLQHGMWLREPGRLCGTTVSDTTCGAFGETKVDGAAFLSWKLCALMLAEQAGALAAVRDRPSARPRRTWQWRTYGTLIQRARSVLEAGDTDSDVHAAAMSCLVHGGTLHPMLEARSELHAWGPASVRACAALLSSSRNDCRSVAFSALQQLLRWSGVGNNGSPAPEWASVVDDVTPQEFCQVLGSVTPVLCRIARTAANCYRVRWWALRMARIGALTRQVSVEELRTALFAAPSRTFAPVWISDLEHPSKKIDGHRSSQSNGVQKLVQSGESTPTTADLPDGRTLLSSAAVRLFSYSSFDANDAGSGADDSTHQGESKAAFSMIRDFVLDAVVLLGAAAVDAGLHDLSATPDCVRDAARLAMPEDEEDPDKPDSDDDADDSSSDDAGESGARAAGAEEDGDEEFVEVEDDSRDRARAAMAKAEQRKARERARKKKAKRRKRKLKGRRGAGAAALGDGMDLPGLDYVANIAGTFDSTWQLVLFSEAFGDTTLSAEAFRLIWRCLNTSIEQRAAYFEAVEDIHGDGALLSGVARMLKRCLRPEPGSRDVDQIESCAAVLAMVAEHYAHVGSTLSPARVSGLLTTLLGLLNEPWDVVAGSVDPVNALGYPRTWFVDSYAADMAGGRHSRFTAATIRHALCAVASVLDARVRDDADDSASDNEEDVDANGDAVYGGMTYIAQQWPVDETAGAEELASQAAAKVAERKEARKAAKKEAKRAARKAKRRAGVERTDDGGAVSALIDDAGQLDGAVAVLLNRTETADPDAWDFRALQRAVDAIIYANESDTRAGDLQLADDSTFFACKVLGRAASRRSTANFIAFDDRSPSWATKYSCLSKLLRLIVHVDSGGSNLSLRTAEEAAFVVTQLSRWNGSFLADAEAATPLERMWVASPVSGDMSGWRDEDDDLSQLVRVACATAQSSAQNRVVWSCLLALCDVLGAIRDVAAAGDLEPPRIAFESGGADVVAVVLTALDRRNPCTWAEEVVPQVEAWGAVAAACGWLSMLHQMQPHTVQRSVEQLLRDSPVMHELSSMLAWFRFAVIDACGIPRPQLASSRFAGARRVLAFQLCGLVARFLPGLVDHDVECESGITVGTVVRETIWCSASRASSAPPCVVCGMGANGRHDCSRSDATALGCLVNHGVDVVAATEESEGRSTHHGAHVLPAFWSYCQWMEASDTLHTQIELPLVNDIVQHAIHRARRLESNVLGLLHKVLGSHRYQSARIAHAAELVGVALENLEADTPDACAAMKLIGLLIRTSGPAREELARRLLKSTRSGPQASGSYSRVLLDMFYGAHAEYVDKIARSWGKAKGTARVVPAEEVLDAAAAEPQRVPVRVATLQPAAAELVALMSTDATIAKFLCNKRIVREILAFVLLRAQDKSPSVLRDTLELMHRAFTTLNNLVQQKSTAAKDDWYASLAHDRVALVVLRMIALGEHSFGSDTTLASLATVALRELVSSEKSVDGARLMRAAVLNVGSDPSRSLLPFLGGRLSAAHLSAAEHGVVAAAIRYLCEDLGLCRAFAGAGDGDDRVAIRDTIVDTIAMCVPALTYDRTMDGHRRDDAFYEKLWQVTLLLHTFLTAEDDVVRRVFLRDDTLLSACQRGFLWHLARTAILQPRTTQPVLDIFYSFIVPAGDAQPAGQRRASVTSSSLDSAMLLDLLLSMLASLSSDDSATPSVVKVLSCILSVAKTVPTAALSFSDGGNALLLSLIKPQVWRWCGAAALSARVIGTLADEKSSDRGLTDLLNARAFECLIEATALQSSASTMAQIVRAAVVFVRRCRSALFERISHLHFGPVFDLLTTASAAREPATSLVAALLTVRATRQHCIQRYGELVPLALVRALDNCSAALALKKNNATATAKPRKRKKTRPEVDSEVFTLVHTADACVDSMACLAEVSPTVVGKASVVSALARYVHVFQECCGLTVGVPRVLELLDILAPHNLLHAWPEKGYLGWVLDGALSGGEQSVPFLKVLLGLFLSPTVGPDNVWLASRTTAVNGGRTRLRKLLRLLSNRNVEVAGIATRIAVALCAEAPTAAVFEHAGVVAAVGKAALREMNYREAQRAAEEEESREDPGNPKGKSKPRWRFRAHRADVQLLNPVLPKRRPIAEEFVAMLSMLCAHAATRELVLEAKSLQKLLDGGLARFVVTFLMTHWHGGSKAVRISTNVRVRWKRLLERFHATHMIVRLLAQRSAYVTSTRSIPKPLSKMVGYGLLHALVPVLEGPDDAGSANASLALLTITRTAGDKFTELFFQHFSYDESVTQLDGMADGYRALRVVLSTSTQPDVITSASLVVQHLQTDAASADELMRRGVSVALYRTLNALAGLLQLHARPRRVRRRAGHEPVHGYHVPLDDPVVIPTDGIDIAEAFRSTPDAPCGVSVLDAALCAVRAATCLTRGRAEEVTVPDDVHCLGCSQMLLFALRLGHGELLDGVAETMCLVSMSVDGCRALWSADGSDLDDLGVKPGGTIRVLLRVIAERPDPRVVRFAIRVMDNMIVNGCGVSEQELRELLADARCFQVLTKAVADAQLFVPGTIVEGNEDIGSALRVLRTAAHGEVLSAWDDYHSVEWLIRVLGSAAWWNAAIVPVRLLCAGSDNSSVIAAACVEHGAERNALVKSLCGMIASNAAVAVQEACVVTRRLCVVDETAAVAFAKASIARDAATTASIRLVDLYSGDEPDAGGVSDQPAHRRVLQSITAMLRVLMSFTPSRLCVWRDHSFQALCTTQYPLYLLDVVRSDANRAMHDLISTTQVDALAMLGRVCAWEECDAGPACLFRAEPRTRFNGRPVCKTVWSMRRANADGNGGVQLVHATADAILDSSVVSETTFLDYATARKLAQAGVVATLLDLLWFEGDEPHVLEAVGWTLAQIMRTLGADGLEFLNDYGTDSSKPRWTQLLMSSTRSSASRLGSTLALATLTATPSVARDGLTQLQRSGTTDYSPLFAVIGDPPSAPPDDVPDGTDAAEPHGTTGQGTANGSGASGETTAQPELPPDALPLPSESKGVEDSADGGAAAVATRDEGVEPAAELQTPQAVAVDMEASSDEDLGSMESVTPLAEFSTGVSTVGGDYSHMNLELRGVAADSCDAVARALLLRTVNNFILADRAATPVTLVDHLLRFLGAPSSTFDERAYALCIAWNVAIAGSQTEDVTAGVTQHITKREAKARAAAARKKELRAAARKARELDQEDLDVVVIPSESESDDDDDTVPEVSTALEACWQHLLARPVLNVLHARRCAPEQLDGPARPDVNEVVTRSAWQAIADVKVAAELAEASVKRSLGFPDGLPLALTAFIELLLHPDVNVRASAQAVLMACSCCRAAHVALSNAASIDLWNALASCRELDARDVLVVETKQLALNWAARWALRHDLAPTLSAVSCLSAHSLLGVLRWTTAQLTIIHNGNLLFSSRSEPSKYRDRSNLLCQLRTDALELLVSRSLSDGCDIDLDLVAEICGACGLFDVIRIIGRVFAEPLALLRLSEAKSSVSRFFGIRVSRMHAACQALVLASRGDSLSQEERDLVTSAFKEYALVLPAACNDIKAATKSLRFNKFLWDRRQWSLWRLLEMPYLISIAISRSREVSGGRRDRAGGASSMSIRELFGIAPHEVEPVPLNRIVDAIRRRYPSGTSSEELRRIFTGLLDPRLTPGNLQSLIDRPQSAPSTPDTANDEEASRLLRHLFDDYRTIMKEAMAAMDEVEDPCSDLYHIMRTNPDMADAPELDEGLPWCRWHEQHSVMGAGLSVLQIAVVGLTWRCPQLIAEVRRNNETRANAGIELSDVLLANLSTATRQPRVQDSANVVVSIPPKQPHPRPRKSGSSAASAQAPQYPVVRCSPVVSSSVMHSVPETVPCPPLRFDHLRAGDDKPELLIPTWRSVAHKWFVVVGNDILESFGLSTYRQFHNGAWLYVPVLWVCFPFLFAVGALRLTSEAGATVLPDALACCFVIALVLCSAFALRKVASVSKYLRPAVGRRPLPPTTSVNWLMPQHLVELVFLAVEAWQHAALPLTARVAIPWSGDAPVAALVTSAGPDFGMATASPEARLVLVIIASLLWIAVVQALRAFVRFGHLKGHFILNIMDDDLLSAGQGGLSSPLRTAVAQSLMPVRDAVVIQIPAPQPSSTVQVEEDESDAGSKHSGDGSAEADTSDARGQRRWLGCLSRRAKRPAAVAPEGTVAEEQKGSTADKSGADGGRGNIAGEGSAEGTLAGDGGAAADDGDDDETKVDEAAQSSDEIVVKPNKHEGGDGSSSQPQQGPKAPAAPSSGSVSVPGWSSLSLASVAQLMAQSLSGGLFLPLMILALSTAQCETAGLAASECSQDVGTASAFFGMFAVASLVPTATLAPMQLFVMEPLSTVRHAPLYWMVALCIKAIIAASYVFFAPTVPILFLFMSVVCNAVLCVANVRLEPCSLLSVSAWKSSVFAGAACTSFAAMVMACMDATSALDDSPGTGTAAAVANSVDALWLITLVLGGALTFWVHREGTFPTAACPRRRSARVATERQIVPGGAGESTLT